MDGGGDIYPTPKIRMEEVWKQSYVPLWEVSSLGRVKNKRLGRVIKPFLHNGYLNVGSNARGQQIRRHKVHRLVCFAFHGTSPFDNCVDHIDGNKENNRADNLRWCDFYENSSKGNRPPKSWIGAEPKASIDCRTVAGMYGKFFCFFEEMRAEIHRR